MQVVTPWGRRPCRDTGERKAGSRNPSGYRAPLRPDEGLVLGAEHVVPGHLGRIDRNGEQADTLFRRQQGAMGHDGLVLMAGGHT
jgi:hypothetical protein